MSTSGGDGPVDWRKDMEVEIRCSFKMKVRHGDTIGAVKAKISSEFGISTEAKTLVVGDDTLTDDEIMAYYCDSQDDVIVLLIATVQPPAPPQFAGGDNIDLDNLMADIPDSSMEQLRKYDVLEMIRVGDYGAVYKLRNRRTNELVALSKVRMVEGRGVPATVLKEVSLLNDLKHPNVMSAPTMVYSPKRLYLLSEYLELTLKEHMDSYPESYHDPKVMKSLLYQILCGMEYCHSKSVVHQNLNPENILIKLGSNVLKISGFRLARTFGTPVTSKAEVLTPYYRAPEILLGSGDYSTPMDMWSIGCIFGEMASKKPLFPGKSRVDELLKVFNVMGTPTEDTWQGITSLMRSQSERYPKLPSQDLKVLVPELNEKGVDLLRKMLTLDPKRRISARQATKHEYFQE